MLLAAFYLSSSAFGATLSDDEVKALKDIAKTLGKKDWDFSVDPCSPERNWKSLIEVNEEENAVICNCSFANATICHVTNISLLGNRITGSIPIEIANISTLQSFVVEANQLSGNLPAELGNLSQIQRMLLSSNNFTGEIPPTFAKLTSLQDLVIQGSGFSGPIPSGISLMKSLIVLRISDLKGSEFSPFPRLDNLPLRHLYLTGNSFTGSVPTWAKSVKNV
ncbi:unnamed protein product [Lupinus luteus]|uniref:Uncharacterized protein n=1 Tax=Lupinus luteus TaxID=3873 RepID=A0AAV1WMV0_LUPLU